MAQLQIRALLVDDDPLLLALLSAFLQARGYAVEEAADGQEALQRLEGGGFNLVVTDRNMPRMDGLALARAIRARHDDSYVYCIMLTASFEEASLVAAMEAGVDDFLAKPLRPAELGARLRAAERVLALEAGLAARNRELADAYGQLSRDLELARSLQLGQLPPPQRFDGIVLEGMFEASSYVGGDLYDYFAVGDDHLAFYLADVSGHGVAAAMAAVGAQHQVRSLTLQHAPALLRQGASLGGVAETIVGDYNRRFLEGADTSLYLTMVFGLLSRRERTGALVQAGHPPALLAAPGQDFIAMGVGGLPVGILPDAQYEAMPFEAPPGARLALYSDGITECPDPVGQPFGAGRLQSLLQEHRQAGAGEACGAVRQALRGWRGGAFEDDVTLLVLESH